MILIFFALLSFKLFQNLPSLPWSNFSNPHLLFFSSPWNTQVPFFWKFFIKKKIHPSPSPLFPLSRLVYSKFSTSSKYSSKDPAALVRHEYYLQSTCSHRYLSPLPSTLPSQNKNNKYIQPNEEIGAEERERGGGSRYRNSHRALPGEDVHRLCPGARRIRVTSTFSSLPRASLSAPLTLQPAPADAYHG